MSLVCEWAVYWHMDWAWWFADVATAINAPNSVKFVCWHRRLGRTCLLHLESKLPPNRRQGTVALNLELVHSPSRWREHVSSKCRCKWTNAVPRAREDYHLNLVCLTRRAQPWNFLSFWQSWSSKLIFQQSNGTGYSALYQLSYMRVENLLKLQYIYRFGLLQVRMSSARHIACQSR